MKAIVFEDGGGVTVVDGVETVTASAGTLALKDGGEAVLATFQETGVAKIELV